MKFRGMSKVKKDGEDICYLCEDCEKYGLCEYYHDRKPTSYICKFFKLNERKIGKWVLVHPLQDNDGGAYECSCCKSGSWEVDPATWKACPWCTALMETENEEEQCDDDCEHCEWVTCPKMEVEE